MLVAGVAAAPVTTAMGVGGIVVGVGSVGACAVGVVVGVVGAGFPGSFLLTVRRDYYLFLFRSGWRQRKIDGDGAARRHVHGIDDGFEAEPERANALAPCWDVDDTILAGVVGPGPPFNPNDDHCCVDDRCSRGPVCYTAGHDPGLCRTDDRRRKSECSKQTEKSMHGALLNEGPRKMRGLTSKGHTGAAKEL